jgi:hypothetical protein
MAERGRRHIGFAGVVLTFLLTSISPSGAQEAPSADDLSVSPTGVTAAGTVQGDKAPSSSLAETDQALLARNDGRAARVMIKLDYDSIAAYQGGVDGLAATSPSVTGRELTGRSSAERAYKSHIDSQRSDIVADIRTAVPEARIGSAFDMVYGGVSAVVPANEVENLLRVDGVVAVQQNKLEQPLTDASPEFLGAPTLYRQLGVSARDAGKGVLFGDLDTAPRRRRARVAAASRASTATTR